MIIICLFHGFLSFIFGLALGQAGAKIHAKYIKQKNRGSWLLYSIITIIVLLIGTKLGAYYFYKKPSGGAPIEEDYEAFQIACMIIGLTPGFSFFVGALAILYKRKEKLNEGAEADAQKSIAALFAVRRQMKNTNKILIFIVLIALVTIAIYTWVYTHLLPSDARDILNNADSFEIISLDPRFIKSESTEEIEKSFYGLSQIKSVVINDRKLMNSLSSQINIGLLRDAINPGIYACLNYRHGIRASHNGLRCDLLISFECHQIYCYTRGKTFGANIGENAEALVLKILGDFPNVEKR